MEGVVVLLLSLLSCCWVASAPAIKGSGECGVLYLAEPIDACSDLTNQFEKGSNCSSPFVLIIRGGCSFEDKVRRAQKAGYKAAIIYDNEEGILVASKTISYMKNDFYPVLSCLLLLT
ncbi:hypothetical protein NC652_041411 [Populus alba x Populus x berolinensis]|nr:hypothetical protein NC652_041411 [Populus alba x Populus x berolinensis]